MLESLILYLEGMRINNIHYNISSTVGFTSLSVREAGPGLVGRDYKRRMEVVVH